MTYVFCVQSGVEFGGEQLRKERTVDPSVMVHILLLYGVSQFCENHFGITVQRILKLTGQAVEFFLFKS